MRTLYNTLWSDPWIKVSDILFKERELIPAYWIGFYDDGSEHDVPIKYPDIIYHSRWDVWKGIFPVEIEKTYSNYKLNIDFLNSIANYELQAMTMMDRMDPDRHSFAFAERQRFFRNLLRKWLAVVDIYNIDLVIGDRIPHRPYDYALYLICLYLKIPYLFLNITNLPNRLIWSYDISRITDSVGLTYNKLLSQLQNKSIKEIIKRIDDDIIDNYLKKKNDYNSAIPTYMVAHKKRQKRNSNIIFLGMNFLKSFLYINKDKTIYRRRNKTFIKDFCDIHPYAKRKNKKIEVSRYNALHYGYINYKAINYKNRLKKYYNLIAEKPDMSEKFIYFALHYQPEATSNPSGDIFTDQYLAVEQISASLPSNYKIYIKEHKSQFLTISEGHKSRFKHLYDDLMKIRNVVFIDLETNPFDLIDNSIAVATITGTAAWEAIVRKKPAIVFGLTWLEAFPGVLKINKKEDNDKIIKFVNNYKFNEKDLLTYLIAIQTLAPKTYSYMLSGKANVDEEICIKNLCNQVSIALKELKNKL